MTELICIGCPLGCRLLVSREENRISVSGNGCPRGEKYAVKEISCPMRTLTSTVRLVNGEFARIPVKTQGEIPKSKMMDCMREIRRASMHAPVEIGAVVIENCADTGVNIVAARNAAACTKAE